MTALDVISLEQAKTFLVVEFNDHDALITRLIKSAVSWVEKRTGYILYKRDKNEYVRDRERLFYYPLGLKTGSNTGVELIEGKLSYTVNITSGDNPRSIVLEIGYDDSASIPNELITACERLITYWYDQRELENQIIPSDVNMLINDWIRDKTI
ncbi:MAG TPA: head-tail connector protein [Ignavibacteriaceae bacterium]